MFVRVLGTAAGGGFPQWNCGCMRCATARTSPRHASPRLQASLAVSAHGRGWSLLNATPDIRTQIEATPQLHPQNGRRGSPIKAILLTDAELDHVLGLFELREGTPLTVFATDAVLAALTDALPARRVLAPYTVVDWRRVEPGVPFIVGDGLSVEALAVDGAPPRYAAARHDDHGWVVAYRIKDPSNGSMICYAPAVEQFTDALAEFATPARWLFFDGTFWADDDISAAAGRALSASDAGHLPISGAHGSAHRLAKLQAARKVYVHINNTNPILDARSPERRELLGAGIEVGEDGLEATL